MPVVVRRIRNRWRLAEASDPSRVARNERGTPLDGGGHAQRGSAEAQARAVNAALAERDKKRSAPRRPSAAKVTE